MANPQLAQYIREQLNAGYDPQTLRTYLISYGHNPAEVDSALAASYPAQVKHIIHFSPAALIGLSIVCVIVLGAGYFFFSSGEDAPSQLLDLNLEPIKMTTGAGDEIVFLTELTNLGSSKRYDILLKYELLSSQTSQIITTKEETRGIETLGSKQTKIDIPLDTKPGNYLLRTIARYNEQRAVATLPVVIEAPQQIPQNPQKEPDLEEPSIIPIQNKTPIQEQPTVPITSPILPSGSSGSLTTFETIEKVEQLAPQNRREAEELCKRLELATSRDLCYNKLGEVLIDKVYCTSILDERTKDVCLSNIAKLSGKSEICLEISKDSRKDSCYMNFVIEKKDYAVCPQVTNQYLKQSCESLKQLSDLNITDVAFYESVLNQSLIEFI